MGAGQVWLSAMVLACCLPAFCCGQASDVPQSMGTPQGSPLQPLQRSGRFSLEVAVTGPDGAPVAGLSAASFRLEDNDKPTPIFSVSQNGPANALQQVLILDELNPGTTLIREAASAFLSHNGGQLSCPVSVYLLNARGLIPVAGPSRDGIALARQLAHPDDRPALGPNVQEEFAALTAQNRMLDPRFKESVSLNALGALTLHLRGQPGRKLVVWMGGGWEPVRLSLLHPLDMITELSTRMREARMVLTWADDQTPSWYTRFVLPAALLPAVNDETASPERMALPVLALHSGGQILVSLHLSQELPGLARQAAESYTITFDPADTLRVDDYRALTLKVDTAGARLRAPAGYYDEPSYYDHRSSDVYRLTVAALDTSLRNPRNRKDPDLLRKLAHTQLTERLSTPHLEQLLALLKEEKERQQLTAVADASAFLQLPAVEMPNDPAPSLDEQHAIVQRMFLYLRQAIPRLPDFFATRKTVFYDPRPVKNDQTWKTFTGDPSLHAAAVSTATVLYRDGKEEVSDEHVKNERGYSHQRSLTSNGEFGVALTTILHGAVGGGTVSWGHWERGPEGMEAVFHIDVPARGSHFATTFCCMPQDHGKAAFHREGAYHGDFAVDGKTGAVLRVAVSADFDLEREPDLPLARSGTVIEYGPVKIGGSTYISPLRSTWVTRGRTVTRISEWGGEVFVYGPFEDHINDMTFSGYHRYGSQSRILTGVSEVPEGRPASPANGSPAGPPQ